MDKDIIRLKHMIDSCEAVVSFIEGKTRKDLQNDRLLISGIIRELEILGEAAGAISAKTRKNHPAVPWKQLNGMRNRLIHAYFDVDLDIVWKTVRQAIPPLLKQLKAILDS